MTLTRSFREIVQRRIKHDPAFRKAMMQEIIELWGAGDIQTGNAMLRDFHKVSKIRKYHRMAWDRAYAKRVREIAWARLFARGSDTTLLHIAREARADIAAGRFVTWEQMEADLDEIEKGAEG